MVKFIENEQEVIHREMLEMIDLVYHQLETVYKAVPEADTKAAWDVLIREKKVNATELKLDCDIEDFIVLYNPVAIDLRFMLAMYKMNCDLERIGDFAEGIARFIIKEVVEPIDSELMKKLRYEEMTRQMLAMLSTAREALVNKDLEKANSIFAMDSLVDEINANVVDVLADYIAQHPGKARFALYFKSVFLRIERAADHVTNLAEEIVYYIDAEVLKHTTSNTEMEEAKRSREDTPTA